MSMLTYREQLHGLELVGMDKYYVSAIQEVENIYRGMPHYSVGIFLHRESTKGRAHCLRLSFTSRFRIEQIDTVHRH